MNLRSRTLALLTALAFFATSCGGASTESSTEPVDESPDSPVAEAEDVADETGIRLISAADGAEVLANPPEDLVILDVRTPEEFDSGHLEGAIMIDFYEDDFAQRIAQLDPDLPYLIYCNSGNRSGQTTQLMNQLEFHDVADVDGGIQAWNASGLPTVN